MFSRRWHTSERRYGVVVERDVRIPVRDGTILVGDLFRPDAPGRFPAILGVHPYNTELQTAPLRPVGYGNLRGFIEAGYPPFYVRRGYAHLIFNVRGTGKSQGVYQFMGPQEALDTYDAIEWVARQPWCDGNVGMFGISYFAWSQFIVASHNPPSLKALFAPYGATDLYRDVFYHGGILAQGFLRHHRDRWDNPRTTSFYRERHGDDAFRAALAARLRDEDVVQYPELRHALEHPDAPRSGPVVDVLLEELDGAFWHERAVDYDAARVPAYLGGDWAIYGLHLPGAFRSWQRWRGPKKLVIGPPLGLDRPVYQYQYESLRWFDHWLKGMETAIMDEPPVRLFVPPTGEWRAADDWPLPETTWTPFYLHAGGLLSEHEPWPGEGCESFEDSTFAHGGLTYLTPTLVENTEVIGPIVVTLYAASSDRELLLFVTLLAVERDGREHELTRGWLRASQRRLRDDSTPWEPVLAHDAREPLVPGKVYELRIPVVPTARLFLAGERIGLRIKGADDEPAHTRLQQLARRHLQRLSPSRITLYHDEDHPSHVLLPITRGNVVGTFLSGGVLPEVEPGEVPQAKIDMPKGID